MTLTLTILVVLAILVVNEWWWRTGRAKGELSRKFVHLTVGTFVAFWPFYLSWNQIRILSVVFLVCVAVSKIFGVFRAIHAVVRPTWGEIFFAIAVGAVTFVTHSRGVYAAALLQMSLADGLAAIVGTRYGKPYEYWVFGHAKSLVGTSTFMLVSYSLLLAYGIYSASLGILVSLGIAAAATITENVAVLGLDNLLVPVLVALAIRLFA